jgi:hypothetical protein
MPAVVAGSRGRELTSPASGLRDNHREVSVSRECGLHMPFDIHIRIIGDVKDNLGDGSASELRF